MVTREEFLLALKNMQESINDLNKRLNNIEQSDKQFLESTIAEVLDEIFSNSSSNLEGGE